MSSYHVNVTHLNLVANQEHIDEALMKGNVIPPVVTVHTKGELVEMSEKQAKRYLEIDAIEKPGERFERAKAQAEAAKQAAQAEIDRQDALVAGHEKAGQDAEAKKSASAKTG